MKYAEVMELPRDMIAYNYLISYMALFKDTLEKICIEKRKGHRGGSFFFIACHLKDKNDNNHSTYFGLFDDEYIWFLNHVTHEFPDVELEIKEEGEKNDTEANTET